MILFVLTTPKSGTASLTNSFDRSFDCVQDPIMRKKSATVMLSYCSDYNNFVIRTHSFEDGEKTLEKVRTMNPNNRCLVVTSIRNPQTWIPAMFVENTKGEGRCPSKSANLLKQYRDWMFTDGAKKFLYHSYILPKVLKEFGVDDLKTQLGDIHRNDGYTILNNPYNDGVFGGCALLFLNMDFYESWPKILPITVPGTEFEPSLSRAEHCPHIADKYQALKDHKLTDLEMKAMIDRHPVMDEYFRAFQT
mmetsp:Transcript_2031/g.2855  ORF Transcript_2031/g.2855 Transcript_2031/m.2855 type:complete len:249 (-) Transcript_2031:177-923(-)